MQTLNYIPLRSGKIYGVFTGSEKSNVLHSSCHRYWMKVGYGPNMPYFIYRCNVCVRVSIFNSLKSNFLVNDVMFYEEVTSFSKKFNFSWLKVGFWALIILSLKNYILALWNKNFKQFLHKLICGVFIKPWSD